MVTIILLCLLTSSTLAAVVPQVLSQPEDASPRELNISHLSLPPEVLTEALFYYVDTLQDQLEQCEGAVRKRLEGDTSPMADSDVNGDGNKATEENVKIGDDNSFQWTSQTFQDDTLKQHSGLTVQSTAASEMNGSSIGSSGKNITESDQDEKVISQTEGEHYGNESDDQELIENDTFEKNENDDSAGKTEEIVYDDSQEDEKQIIESSYERPDTDKIVTDTDERVTDSGHVTNTEGRDNDTERRVTDTDGRVTDTEGRVTDTDGRVTDTEGRVTDTGGHHNYTERRVTDSDGHVTDTEGRVTDTSGHDNDTERRVTDNDRRVTDTEKRDNDTDERGTNTEGRVRRGLLAELETFRAKLDYRAWNSKPRARRSMHADSTAEKMAPERYIPLIGRLVDRLHYLKKSLVVCRQILPSAKQTP